MVPATSKIAAREQSKERAVSGVPAALRRILLHPNPWPVALGYLGLLTLSELVLVFGSILVGMGLHTALLFVLLLHTGWAWQRAEHRFLLGLIFVPLIRVVSVTLPLVDYPLVYWFLITSMPLFAASVVVMRLLRFSWPEAGLVWRGLPLQLFFGLSGIVLGTAEYYILRPEPLINDFQLQQLVVPALILLIGTGYLEELIFRRIMQRTAVDRLGRWPGVAYVALLFAVLHIGYRSWVDFVFVLAVGLLFGWFVNKTGSLVGVTVSHGLTNIWLFLVMPFISVAPLLSAGVPVVSLPSLVEQSEVISVTAAPSLQLQEEREEDSLPASGLSNRPVAEEVETAVGGEVAGGAVETVVSEASGPSPEIENASRPESGFWETYGLYLLLITYGFIVTALLIFKTPST